MLILVAVVVCAVITGLTIKQETDDDSDVYYRACVSPGS